MSDAKDPIRSALGELLRAAVQAAVPDPAAPSEAALRAAALVGRPLSELREAPDATAEVVANLLRGARDLFLDATSDDPARRRAASDALRDLDLHLRSVGVASTDRLADVPEYLARARESREPIAAVLQAIAAELSDGPDAPRR